jgi:sodium/proline symporter
MNNENVLILISMCAYVAITVAIGIFYARRSNQDSESYYIGGRTLGPFVTAISAEASDMSGWLLMGLPGVAYWCGLADAAWTAVGLAIGTYINWRIVATPLRRYSEIANNSITIPEFFSNRFHEKKKVIMTLAAIVILIFFTVYASSCFVTAGKLFSTVFGFDYKYMVVLGAIIVILYTLLGGFLAVSVSDIVQGTLMVLALAAVLVAGIAHAGGVANVIENVKSIPGFFDFFQIATPELNEAGEQIIKNSSPAWAGAGTYGFITILSTMSWGLGYFGMPQVLIRFFAIRSVEELPLARRTAVSWCIVSLIAAVFIGLIGRTIFPDAFTTLTGAENIFITLSRCLFHPILAGIVMAGILASTMSTSDSCLLIASSAIARNIYNAIFKKNATDKDIMLIGRLTLIAISIIGVVIALDENSVIFTIVSFAWAGFGATFGPLMLFSLFYKRTTRTGAIAGMLAGSGMVFFWKLVIRPLGGVFNIYELLPAFLFSALAIFIVSHLTKEPDDKIHDEFNRVHGKS